jgi:hydroxymethylbilane synthase
LSTKPEQINVTIGSRGSDLALAQSRYVAARLRSLPPAPDVNIEIIQTRGDLVLDVPLSQVASSRESGAGSADPRGAPNAGPADRKGIFTKELEDALLAGRIDLAVHSYKDLPSLMPPGLCIAALPERVDAEDVLIFRRELLRSTKPPFMRMEGARIGTSSVRRQALLEHLFPGAAYQDLRGNVPTRLKKLLSDDPTRPDAILLARAGLERLRTAGFFAERPEMQALLDQLEIRSLPRDWFVPAPAQGALAIQCRADDHRIRELLGALHDSSLEECLQVERGVLAALEGGCHLPLGAHCARTASGDLELHLFLGRAAADNRRKASWSLKRTGRDAGVLLRQVITEIKEPLPVIVTGKADRLDELIANRPGAPIVGLPLLSTVENFSDDARTGKDLDNWIMAHSGVRRLFAVFSVAGVRALRNLIDETGHDLSGIEWGVVGQKTAQALHDLFGIQYRFLSPDGTGAGLANLIAEHNPRYDAILALTAEKGREEFYEILFEHGIATLKLSLYRTVAIAPQPARLLELPFPAYVIFGSPSAVDAFFTGVESALPSATRRQAREEGWRFCTLGPTTRDAVQARGRVVYAVASEPDYERFVDEFIV